MKNNIQKNARFQSGLTIVELMIAMGITLFVLAGVMGVYISSKQVYRTQSNLSHLQENARFALDYLARNIRMAGYIGCLPLSAVGRLEDTVSGSTISPNDAFSVYEYDGSEWSDDLPGTDDDVKSGSDILVIKRGHVNEYPLVENMANKVEAIHVDNDNQLDMGDVLLISDCNGAEIFTASYIDENGFITHDELNRSYNTGAVIMKFSNMIYYIGENENGEYSLYRRSSTADDEIIEGIDDMQFDNDESSSKISLLMRSMGDGIAVKQQTFQFNGEQINATDKRIRKVYSVTVNRRNNYK